MRHEEQKTLVRCVDQDGNIYELIKLTTTYVPQPSREGSRAPGVVRYYFNDELVDAKPDATFEILLDGKPVIVKPLEASRGET